jgi:membrane-anchored protein YejM (alkaline phosphatase superfamily)
VASGQALPNILVVLIDALRPDKILPEHTPRIHRFAQEGQNFTNHYSGGNSSRMGLFSFFYGIPSTYWQAFYDMQRQPVLIELMLSKGYEVAAFSSVGFGSPAQIDRTVFAAVGPESKWVAEGEKSGRNHEITELWQQWLGSRADTTQPFFSFLYYDPGSIAARVSAATVSGDELAERYAAYLQGIAAVDGEVDTVLQALDAYRTERETIVIITSDHGYEFDELGLGYIGHASNFGPYQLRSALMIDWPGMQPRNYSHRSAHQDVPVTLLQRAFDCGNPATDYSSGQNLFAGRSWEWIMAGSYSSHAIVEPDKIVVTYPGGLIELLDANYRPAPGLELDAERMQEAMLEMRRFYK